MHVCHTLVTVLYTLGDGHKKTFFPFVVRAQFIAAVCTSSFFLFSYLFSIGIRKQNLLYSWVNIYICLKLLWYSFSTLDIIILFLQISYMK